MYAIIRRKRYENWQAELGKISESPGSTNVEDEYDDPLLRIRVPGALDEIGHFRRNMAERARTCTDGITVTALGRFFVVLDRRNWKLFKAGRGVIRSFRKGMKVREGELVRLSYLNAPRLADCPEEPEERSTGETYPDDSDGDSFDEPFSGFDY